MKLIALRCGVLRTRTAGAFGGDPSPDAVGDVPVMCFAVDTGDGVFVFDTGMHEACCGAGAADHLGPLSGIFEPRCGRDELIDARLEQAGYALDDIRWVCNSHLHFDHAGRNGVFRGARQLVRTRELADAHRRLSRPHGFLAADLAQVTDEGWDYDDRFDVTGDGSLTLVSTPGHTAGHQSLLVTFPDGARFVCVGDASYVLSGIDRLAVGPRPLDASAALDSLVLLRDLGRDGVTLLTSHDIGQWRHCTDLDLIHAA